MKILVSACLVGKNTRYDAKNSYSQKVIDFIKDKDVILVCPEQMGGLSTPRLSCEILNNRIINQNGDDKTKEFYLGAQQCLKIAQIEKVDLVIFKSKSPSCSNHLTYDGTFSRKLIAREGITAKLLIENGFKVISEDEI